LTFRRIPARFSESSIGFLPAANLPLPKVAKPSVSPWG
jgi:hypothetical protein